jgi:two-component system CitB family sensor kinase/two-component system sensor histidine kinase DcuS
MIVLLGLLVLVQIGISGIIFGSLVADILEDQIGKRALDIAQTVARDPLVARGITAGDPEQKVQALVDPIRQTTGAEYIVVCDAQGVRLSHPDSWKIGQKFVGGDEGPALEEGRSYVSSAVGTLGPSLRGFAPVYGAQRQVVGFVAVGYLLEDLDRTIIQHQLQPRVFVFMMALVGLLGAVLIAGRFKRAILGLEPREIASLFQERGAILETIREGVLAVDRHGEVRLANAAARRDLELVQEGGEGLAGQPVSHVIPQAPVAEVLEKGQAVLDREIARNGVAFLVNVIPVIHQGQVMGAVASFRRKDELDRLASELSQVREYSELLRAQSHEHSNQLHTLAGLIQIGAPQEALDLILHETRDYQDLISLLNTAVPHPLVSGLIIGKCHRASELKVQFLIDPESSFGDIPAAVNQEQLVTILGNLVDNAFEAALAGSREPKVVRLSMTDLGRDLIIEVEDSGQGVPAEQVDHIFQRGVTSKKGANHGVGLHLVRENLATLQGQVTVGESELGGALFTVSIPKEAGASS